MGIFFAASFSPAGVNFNAYPQTVVSLSNISMIGNSNITNIQEIPNLVTEDDINEITVNDGTLYLVPGESLKRAVELEAEQVVVFEDAPAVRARLKSPILKIDGQKITSLVQLRDELDKRSPGESIEIVTLDEDIRVKQSIELADREGKSYLGIGFIGENRGGFSGLVLSLIRKVKDPLIYYEPAWNGDFPQFIYDLLWWIVVINILVALFNMLPVSILDGGRFFYLTVWGITGSETFGKKAFSFATWFILALIALMMVRWLFVFVS